jgi:hypothetical protein
MLDDLDKQHMKEQQKRLYRIKMVFDPATGMGIFLWRF